MTTNGELENRKKKKKICAFNTSLSQQMDLEEFRNGQCLKGDKYHYVQCSTFCKHFTVWHCVMNTQSKILDTY